MAENRCRFCVGEFLKGGETCSHCGEALESPIGAHDSRRARSAGEVFSSPTEILNRDSAEKDDNEIENILFDWKNPVVLNIVGSLVCTMLLIATLLEFVGR